MAFTYILRLNDDSYYIGSTNDIVARLKKHNAGEVFSTKNKLPIVLVFKEYYETRSQAQKKEYQIKKWKSKKMIERVIQIGPLQ